VLAVLNRPIVTDYVPAARPPWLLLALLVGLAAFGLPHTTLTLVVATSTVLLLVGVAFNRDTSTPDCDDPPEATSSHG
jgi:hypothetical protein